MQHITPTRFKVTWAYRATSFGLRYKTVVVVFGSSGELILSQQNFLFLKSVDCDLWERYGAYTSCCFGFLKDMTFLTARVRLNYCDRPLGKIYIFPAKGDSFAST
ncbi:hypothetical protein RCO25_17010 [Paenibacillus sp. LHD-38]|nr:hypothetical protein [Paenibacillus sp. LHD-38]MDQ8736184.1 hypothetical protein [Paenibacillus sp. LHD-38]